MRSGLIGLLLLIVGFGLAACDNAEDRAQEHYERSIELVEEGDVARALVELRNVFQLVPDHRDARMLFAEIEEGSGKTASAYKQVRLVVETYPQDQEALFAATRLAAELGDWPGAERYAQATRELVGDDIDDPVLDSIELVLKYQDARERRDLETARALAQEGMALLDANPKLFTLRLMVIDNVLLREDWPVARDVLATGIEQKPDARQLYMMQLAVLEKLGELDELETLLRAMVAQFPDDSEATSLLLRWYLGQNRIDDAEGYLREQVADDPDNSDPKLVLIRFLSQVRDRDAALAEVEQILADTAEDDPNRVLYRAARAGLDFDAGRRDAAMAELQDLLEGNASAEVARRIKIALAKMYLTTDNPVGSQALIEEVLAEDPTEIEALKMRAVWLTQDDKPDEALVQLRLALDQAPNDPATLTLMAQAHDRAGNKELSGEMLSLAVEASGNAPEESMRYATYLIQDERFLAAEDILIDSLRLHAGSVPMLTMLGQTYVQLKDWGRLQGVIDALLRQDETKQANELTARMLAAQDRQDELLGFLDELAAGENGNNQVIASAIRLQLAQGDTEGALAAIDKYLAERPDDLGLRFIKARALAGTGELDAAKQEMQDLLEQAPKHAPFWLTLYNITRDSDTPEAAEQVLDDALVQVPADANLLWIKASLLEKRGDIPGAIEIYENLYERNSSSVVVANNLASLISATSDDPATVDRAFSIARRLRGTDVPAFQDTYGWLLARRGNHELALEYLIPAADGLPEDPTVQYHLAHTYVLAGRDTDALDAFKATQALLDKATTDMPYAEEVRQEIDRLTQATAGQ